VIVCPERAIIAGDLDDPGSQIATMVRENRTLVRRPEQNTGPNVHYKGVEPSLLNPGEAERPSMYLWSDRPPHKPESWPLPVLPDTRVVLDAGHRVEWGWPVALYLVTKGIAAGAGMLAPFAAALGLGAWPYVPELLALVFTLATTGLLIEDLARPALFVRLLTRPNWRSWLVRGGVVLGAYGAVSAGIIGLRMLGLDGPIQALRWVEAALGAAAAGYTALLFAQCEGRDLWQSPWLLPHLLVQAVLCGAVGFAVFSAEPATLGWIAAGCAVVHGAIAAVERFGPHPTTNATQGAAFLGTVRLGPLRAWRDGLIIGVGLGVPAALLLPAGAWVPVLAGLYLYEWAYVRSGQLPPLS
jgi:hypothetical protein